MALHIKRKQKIKQKFPMKHRMKTLKRIICHFFNMIKVASLNMRKFRGKNAAFGFHFIIRKVPKIKLMSKRKIKLF